MRVHSGLWLVPLVAWLVVGCGEPSPDEASGPRDDHEEARYTDAEEVPIMALANLISAQAMMHHACKIDVDADAEGEYGGLLELSGTAAGRMAATVRIPDFPAFEFEHGNGTARLAGYHYRVFLPDAEGLGIGEPAGGFTAASVSAPMCERAWCCYAWPIAYGRSGRRTFFANQEGKILETDASRYDGVDGGPAPDAAFLGPGIVGSSRDPGPSLFSEPRARGHVAVGKKGQDGNLWKLAEW